MRTPLAPHDHRDLSGMAVRALVTPGDDLVRGPNGWTARVYAEVPPALYLLGTVRRWPERAQAMCEIPGCAWKHSADTAARAAAALAEHSGVGSGVAHEVAAVWAEDLGDA